VFEAGEIDRAAGLRQGAGKIGRLPQFFSQPAYRGDRIVWFGSGHHRRLKRNAITEPFIPMPSRD
jgi:hypothetical protein